MQCTHTLILALQQKRGILKSKGKIKRQKFDTLWYDAYEVETFQTLPAMSNKILKKGKENFGKEKLEMEKKI